MGLSDCVDRTANSGDYRQSFPGIIRFMNSSNIGTVKAVSPWFGLHTMPLPIRELRVGASEDTSALKQAAISPDLCGPAPRSAMARRYFYSFGVSRSKRTLKKLSSSAAIAVTEAVSTASIGIGDD